MGRENSGPGKGNTNNPHGRPKGVPNKTTKEAHELFITIMSGEIDRIKEALDALYTKDQVKYLDILHKYMPYYMPKKIDVKSDDKPITALNITVTDEKTKKDIEDLGGDKND